MAQTPIEPIQWLVGLRAISEHLGKSPHQVLRLAAKYGLPLKRLPFRNRMGWCYHLTVKDVDHWLQTMATATHAHVARHRAHQPRPTREGDPRTTTRPAPPLATTVPGQGGPTGEG